MKCKRFSRFIGGIVTSAILLSLIGCANPSTPVADNQTIEESNNTDSTDVADVDEKIEEALNSVNGLVGDEGGIKDEVMQIDVSQDHKYYGQHVSMVVRGMEEIEGLHSAGYDDIPKTEGNVFVIFYLEMSNEDGTDMYFYPDFCEFDVDGTPTTTTFLGNSPSVEEYDETIFGWLKQTHNGLYYDKRGFMVIEAPKDWQNITFTYTGWQFDGLGNIIVTNKFTRDDLHLPE